VNSASLRGRFNHGATVAALTRRGEWRSFGKMQVQVPPIVIKNRVANFAIMPPVSRSNKCGLGYGKFDDRPKDGEVGDEE
jgi:hypothetical protein